MKTEIVLLRHGQSMAPVDGLVQGAGLTVPLSEDGHAQAKEVAEKLKGESFDVIISSTAKRSVDTTMYVLKHHQTAEYKKIEEFHERSKGVAEGMRKEDFSATYPEVVEAWSREEDVRIAGGENFEDVHNRVFPILINLIEEYKGKRILLSIHGNVIRSLIGAILESPHNLRPRIEQKYCALSEIYFDHDRNRWGVVCVNK